MTQRSNIRACLCSDDSVASECAGLPASLTGPGYNVILYYDGDNGTAGRVGRYEVNGVSQWGRDAGVNFTGTFTEGQTTTDPVVGGVIDNIPAAGLNAVPAGNYMTFRGLTAPSFTLNVQASLSANATNRAPLNGIQIVAVPEPSSIALFALAALGGLGLFFRGRRSA